MSARFLSFVVEETLAGRGDRLKAFTVATLGLGRSDSFDPQSDSIVRVQAVRLRKLLRAYHEGRGAGETVRIDLPRGGYQTCFIWAPDKANPDRPAADRAEARPAAAPPGVASHRFVWGPLLALSVALLVVLTAGSFLISRSGAAVATPLERPPTIWMEAALGDAETPGAKRALASIEAQLRALDYVDVNASGTPSPGPYDYTLATRFLPAGGRLVDIDFSLRRADTGDVAWARRFARIDLGEQSAIETAGRLTATAVGDSGGVVLSDLRARMKAQPVGLTDFRCRLSAVEYLRARAPGLRSPVRDCLEALTAANPDDAIADELLSTLLIVDYLDDTEGSRGAADLQRAIQLARRGFDLAPQRARSQAALFYAQFFDKRFDDAFEIAGQAVASSPASMLIAMRVGRAEVSRGRYNEGVAQLSRVEEASSGEEPVATAFLALAAHIRGDVETRRSLLSRKSAERTALGLSLRIIDSQGRGDIAGEASAVVRLRRDFPGFCADIPAALERYALIDSLRDSLLQGLKDSGLANVR